MTALALICALMNIPRYPTRATTLRWVEKSYPLSAPVVVWAYCASPEVYTRTAPLRDRLCLDVGCLRLWCAVSGERTSPAHVEWVDGMRRDYALRLSYHARAYWGIAADLQDGGADIDRTRVWASLKVPAQDAMGWVARIEGNGM